MARHFLDLAGAATVETDSYLLAQRAVADAVDANAMAVLHGDAGLGKTFAVEDALAAPRLPLLWVSFPSRPTPRLIAATLLEAITGRPTRLDRFAIIRRLVELLTERPAIVVVDESQLWRLVDVHLRAERVRHLVVLRAHTLTYLALRKVADHAHGVDARLWRVVHRERPPAAVAQLLEAVPHETAAAATARTHACARRRRPPVRPTGRRRPGVSVPRRDPRHPRAAATRPRAQHADA
jgi:hypothetical protein